MNCKLINNLITTEQLKYIVPNIYDENINIYTPLLNEYLPIYDINSKLRLAHFIAQIAHESCSFNHTLELASGQAYEGRKSLGNNQKGDGVKYKGRGLIQITGRYNYTELSKKLNIPLLEQPQLLEQPKWALLSAIYYWNSRKLNNYADVDDILTITKRINGGLNAIKQRQELLLRAKSIL